MVHETLAAAVAPVPASRWTSAGALLGAVGLGALALSFAWSDPDGNAWPAGALFAALSLDGLGWLAWRTVLGRAPAARRVAVPSLVLAPERGLLAVALLFAAVVVIWEDGFAVLASLLAGLLAMGGIARLAIARVVLAGEGARKQDTIPTHDQEFPNEGIGRPALSRTPGAAAEGDPGPSAKTGRVSGGIERAHRG